MFGDEDVSSLEIFFNVYTFTNCDVWFCHMYIAYSPLGFDARAERWIIIAADLDIKPFWLKHVFKLLSVLSVFVAVSARGPQVFIYCSQLSGT